MQSKKSIVLMDNITIVLQAKEIILPINIFIHIAISCSAISKQKIPPDTLFWFNL